MFILPLNFAFLVIIFVVLRMFFNLLYHYTVLFSNISKFLIHVYKYFIVILYPVFFVYIA